MQRRDLEIVVRQALNRLFACDAALLADDVSEWAVAHRLAVYIEQLLPGWNVDCEYNRQGGAADPKAMADGRHARPDIVVHHRGCLEREHNLLAIELKKRNSANDASKACEYTGAPAGARQFQYLHGLTIVMDERCRLAWFQNGQGAT